MENFDPDLYLKEKLGGDLPSVDAPVDQIQLSQFDPDAYLQAKAIQSYDTLQAEYGTPGQQALAGLEGAARGVSLGLSDLALPDQEGAKLRKIANPATEFGGNVLGGGALLGLTGGLAAPAEAALLARGIGPTAAKALGYGAEGLLLSEGALVSDAALGDPDLNAQKILAHLGIGFGAGSALGLAAKAIGATPAIMRSAKSRFGLGETAPEGKALLEGAVISPKEVLKEAGFGPEIPVGKVEEAAAINASSGEIPLGEALHMEDMEGKARTELQKGLNKLKPNWKQIVEAGEKLDAPTPEGMLSSDKHTQMLDYTLTTTPTEFGQARYQLYNEAYKQAASKVAEALGAGTEMSAAEVGTTVRQMITQSLEDAYRPIRELYSAISDVAPLIPIDKSDALKAKQAILNIIDNQALIEGTPEYVLAKSFADGLPKVDSIQKFQNYVTALNRATTTETRYISSLIKDRLEDLEAYAVKQFSHSIKDPNARKLLFQTIPRLEKARKDYKAFRKELASVGKLIFGDKKIHGFQDFLDKIESQSAEQFAKRIFAKNNASALKYLAEKFPEAIKVLSQFEKQSIINKATPKDIFSPVRAISEVSKLSPELRKMMFNPEELGILNYGKTYFDNTLPNFNPSGSAVIRGYQDWFKLSKPVKSTLDYIQKNAEDLKKLNKIKKTIPITEEEMGYNRIQQDKISKLSSLSGYIGKTTEEMKSKAKAVFKATDSTTVRGALLTGATHISEKDYEKQIKRIQELAMSPDGLMEELSSKTAGIYSAAPQITQAMYSSMINAIMFLNAKIPKAPGHMFLTPTWKPSKDQRVRFERVFNAVNDPVSTLKSVKEGSLTNDELEAVRVVHPKLLQEMRQEVMNGMDVDKVRGIPYARKLALAKFLGQPLDENMVQLAIQSNQVSLNAPQLSADAVPKEGRKNPGGGLKNLDLSALASTRTQREEE